MNAVSNTTPLRYLIAIEQEHLLGQLFDKVFVPVAVHEELTDSRTPETVRRRVLALPAWFEVRTVQESQKTTFPVTLHRGEREAILLAETLHADVLLIDERIGRTDCCPEPESPALRNAGRPGTCGQNGIRQ
jgi:predicted nucleic acid-binding protein